MVCIYCGGSTKVTNSRPQIRLYQTWRRRRCATCDAIFTTIEAIDLPTSLAVKSVSGALRQFSRDHLFISVFQALGHRKDPLSDARSITDTITAQLLRDARHAVISSSQIVSTVVKVLERFDRAAAVQYSAYHKI